MRLLKICYQEIKKWRPNDYLKKAIFSHHHVDHVFAVQKFDEECKEKNLPLPKVYSHSLTPKHFDRYIKTQGWNSLEEAIFYTSKRLYKMGQLYKPTQEAFAKYADLDFNEATEQGWKLGLVNSIT